MLKNSKYIIINTFVLVIILFNTIPAYSRPLFQSDVSSTDAGVSYHVNFSKAEQVFDELKEATLSKRINGYTNTMDVTSCVNYRGLPINLSFASNSTSLLLEVADASISKQFEGGTRSESLDLFNTWIKSSSDNEVKDLYRSLIKNSSIDFLAGNPNSLMASMVEFDFETGLDVKEFESDQFGSGINFASFDQGGYISNKITFPNKFKLQNSETGSLTFKLPFGISIVESAESFHGELGMVYNHLINENWGISPSLNYGLGGSSDLGSSGSIVSATVTNLFKAENDLNLLALGTMFGYYKTLDFSFQGYTVNPDISNLVIRNSFHFQYPIFGNGYYVQYFAIDTRYFGSKLYNSQYNELGLFIGYLDIFKLGATYTTSPKASGIAVNLRILNNLGD